MKCPKCNYTSFDFNRVCPKCGNDNSEEQTRLNLSPNKPDPPFFLASLVGMGGTANLGALADDAGTPSAQTASEEVDKQDLLIALDDLPTDDVQPDTPEPPGPSTDGIVFDTDDSKENTLETLASAEDEILFDLEPASEEDALETIDMDPFDKKGFSDPGGPDEKPVAVGVEEIRDVTDEITFELEDTPQQVEQSRQKDTPDEIESAHGASQGLFLEEPEGKADEADLFLVDESAEPALILDEEAPAEKDTPGEKGFWDSHELEKQAAAFDLEETTDKKEDVNLFQDLDVEPLDFELSLDDVEKKS